MPAVTASLWEEWEEEQMPQVDMQERAPQGYCSQDKGWERRQSVGRDLLVIQSSRTEPGVDRKGMGLPSPRWLVLSCLRELSSWLPW